MKHTAYLIICRIVKSSSRLAIVRMSDLFMDALIAAKKLIIFHLALIDENSKDDENEVCRVAGVRQSKSRIRQCIRHWAYIRYY